MVPDSRRNPCPCLSCPFWQYEFLVALAAAQEAESKTAPDRRRRRASTSQLTLGCLCGSAEAESLALLLPVERQAATAFLQQPGRGEFHGLPAIHHRAENIRREERQPDEA